jgi:hypothetical protein
VTVAVERAVALADGLCEAISAWSLRLG